MIAAAITFLAVALALTTWAFVALAFTTTRGPRRTRKEQ